MTAHKKNVYFNAIDLIRKKADDRELDINWNAVNSMFAGFGGLIVQNACDAFMKACIIGPV